MQISIEKEQIITNNHKNINILTFNNTRSMYYFAKSGVGPKKYGEKAKTVVYCPTLVICKCYKPRHRIFIVSD